MEDLFRVLARIDRERCARLLAEAVNEYSPSFAEEPVIRLLGRHFTRHGLPFRAQPVPIRPDGLDRANLIVTLGPQPPVFLWVGHLDTVSLWHDEEYGARIEGDQLFGLGACDMKGACAAMIEALTAIRESGLPLSRGACAAFVVGEEEYGDGSKALIREVRAPLTVVGEPTSLKPCTGHFAYLEYRFESLGQRAHAALPEVGANAIHGMLEWMMEVIEKGRELRLGEHAAINPREIHGGEPGFVTAARCEAFLDCHLPPGLEIEAMDRMVGAAREAVLRVHPELELRWEAVTRAPGFSHDPGHAAFEPLRRAFEREKLPWTPDLFRSHSDAGLFHEAGAMTVVCGPGDLSLAHRRGEKIALAEVERAARLYAGMILAACG